MAAHARGVRLRASSTLRLRTTERPGDLAPEGAEPFSRLRPVPAHVAAGVGPLGLDVPQLSLDEHDRKHRQRTFALPGESVKESNQRCTSAWEMSATHGHARVRGAAAAVGARAATTRYCRTASFVRHYRFFVRSAVIVSDTGCAKSG